MSKSTKFPFTLNDAAAFKSNFYAIEYEMKKRLQYLINEKREKGIVKKGKNKFIGSFD